MAEPSGVGPEVIVVSTHTLDRVPQADGCTVEQPGGPAYYMGVALARLGTAYRIITGDRVFVDVIKDDGHEHYVIPQIRTIPLPSIIRARAVVLSPVMHEIDARDLPTMHGLVGVDLQGFVRQPGVASGSLMHNVDLQPLLHRADVVKGSAEEFSALDTSSLAAADSCILLTTHGSHGVNIRKGRDAQVIEARPVQTDDTIGAGDMYLAAFMVYLIHNDDAPTAGWKAARFTEEMLRERSAPHET